MFFDDMTGATNDGRMVGWNVFQNAGDHRPNYQGSGVTPANVAASANGRGTHMPSWWKASGSVLAEYKDSEIWPFWAPWIIVQAEANYSDAILGSNLGIKVVIGRQIAIAVKTNNEKVVIRDTYANQGYFKANIFQQFWVSDGYTTRANSNGGLDFVWDNDQRSMHYLGTAGNDPAFTVHSGRINLGSITGTGTGTHGLKCILFAAQISIAADTAGANGNPANARLLSYLGHDYMPTATSSAANDNRPAVSHTRVKRLTATPTWFCTATLLDGRQDHTVPSGTIAGVSFAEFQTLGITF